LYQQSEIYPREGVELERSTLADWVGGTSALLAPLVEALRRHVMSAYKLHADDTPVPMLPPDNGKTKPGGCGPACAVIVLRATRRRQRSGTLTRRTARRSIRECI